jgi:hypothetical protein
MAKQKVEFKAKPQNVEITTTVNNGSQVKIMGQPFVFCGRIVEAYYTNAEQDSVQIMWSDGKVNRAYNLNADKEDDQFKALLSEYSYESLDLATRDRNESVRQQFRDAFNNYAARTGLTSGVSEEERQEDLNLIFDFDVEIPEKKEALFKLKLLMFEQDIVKNSKSKVQKTAIRKATTPIEAIVAYSKFIKK